MKGKKTADYCVNRSVGFGKKMCLISSQVLTETVAKLRLDQFTFVTISQVDICPLVFIRCRAALNFLSLEKHCKAAGQLQF